MRDEVKARAGRLGGLRTKRSMDSQFYARIGRKGGLRVVERYGIEHMRELGHLGNQAKQWRLQPDPYLPPAA